MGPKKRSPARQRDLSPTSTPNSVEEQLKELINKVDMQTKLISELHTMVKQHEETIANLRDTLNSREQYARSWSVCILHLPLPEGDESNTKTVMKEVYNKVCLPILDGLVDAGEIHDVPSMHSLIETAHILPSKSKVKPIIVRFFSRYWRSLLFKYRKQFAAASRPPQSPPQQQRE
jgi:hypothetical protein